MKKIPLESTIVGSYGFLFRNLLSIVGTMWLPMVLFLAVLGGILWQLIPHEWLQGNFPDHIDKSEVRDWVFGHLPVMIFGAGALMLTGLLVRAMVNVGILRHALGQKTSPTLIWFSLGQRMWLMVAVIIIGFVAFELVRMGAFLLFVPVNVALAAIPHRPDAVVVLVNMVLALVAFCAVVYVLLRLLFFLPAVVVAENRLSLSRAWGLGSGNVLRMAVVLAAVILPAAILFGIAFYGTIIATVVVQVSKLHPEGPKQVCEFLKSLLPLVPVLGVIVLVAAVVFKGLVLGAIGGAYKAVTEEETP